MIQLIIYYILLTLFTALIFYNAYKMLRLNKDFTFPISTLIVFYFTLGGAFIFPLDSFYGFKGVAIGFHYLPIFDRLFPVAFDNDYLLAIAYYVIFILVFQYSYILFVKRYSQANKITFNEQKKLPFEIVINPYIVLSITVFFIMLSALIMRKEIYEAVSHINSIYTNTRFNSNPYYTVHQLANELCVLIPFIAFSFIIVKSSRFNIRVDNNNTSFFILLVSCVIASLYISLLGNRREILSGFVFCILICLNQFRNIHYSRFLVIFIVVLGLFFSNDFFRSRVVPRKLYTLFHFEERNRINEEKIKKDIALKKEKVLVTKTQASTPALTEIPENSSTLQKVANKKDTLVIEPIIKKDTLPITKINLAPDAKINALGTFASVIFSNELFYAHFSMYGILHKRVPLTYGSSYICLLTSLIPRAIYPNRPKDIYTYYAESVDAKPGQLYTMHQAAAYYLNFGFLGLIFGGIVLGGLFIFAFYINYYPFKKNNTFIILLKYLIPFLICGQLVTFITAGPEAYKAMVLEGILIPVFLVWVCSKNFFLNDMTIDKKAE